MIPLQTEHNDFETMIVHHARFDLVKLKRGVGVMTAAVTAYDRHEESAVNTESMMALGYAGGPGDQLEMEVVRKRSFSSDTRWELMWKHIFCDPEGRYIVWKTGKALEGSKVVLKGRVKEHGEYRGISQTVVTRCSIRPT